MRNTLPRPASRTRTGLTMAAWLRDLGLSGRRQLALLRLRTQRLQAARNVRLALTTLADSAGQEASEPHPRNRQLLVDVSVIVRGDARTGIQRVVRAIVQQLLVDPPAGFDVKPVCASRWQGYRHATLHIWPERIPAAVGPVDVGKGDVFLGLDFAAHLLSRHQVQLARWKMAGARIIVVVYDLLPALHPKWFEAKDVRSYLDWIRAVAIHADRVLCISAASADEMHRWLARHHPGVEKYMEISWFHLGADIAASVPASGVSPDFDFRFQRIVARQAILMVGTVEPRKGHAQALQALEQLWRQGKQINLAIVGKPGWRVEMLVKRLREHPESGHRLFWIEDASDEMLCRLYEHAAGLLMASEGEGFGLPLIEAACHGVPILARDLAVFREIAGNHATYFSGHSGHELAIAISAWSDELSRGKAIRPDGIPHLSWHESTRQLLSRLELP